MTRRIWPPPKCGWKIWALSVLSFACEVEADRGDVEPSLLREMSLQLLQLAERGAPVQSWMATNADALLSAIEFEAGVEFGQKILKGRELKAAFEEVFEHEIVKGFPEEPF
jgi:hypothetical protein